MACAPRAMGGNLVRGLLEGLTRPCSTLRLMLLPGQGLASLAKDFAASASLGGQAGIQHPGPPHESSDRLGNLTGTICCP